MCRLFIVVFIYLSILQYITIHAKTEKWKGTWDRFHFQYAPIFSIPVVPFYDRIGAVFVDLRALKNHSDSYVNLGLAVPISGNRLLTSFNPYRRYLFNQRLLIKTWIVYITGRINDYTFLRLTRLECGRPLVPYNFDSNIEQIWHGQDRRNSPLHDLMVLRSNAEDNYAQPDPEPTQRVNYETIYHHLNQPKHQTTTGPYIIKLAKMHDVIRGEMGFLTLAWLTLQHIGYKTYHYDDIDVIVDCYEWFPKEWGHFICLAPEEDVQIFISSAMLIHNRTLFGVGSFTMKRHEETILVFTDVRPYNELIEKTCTIEDQR